MVPSLSTSSLADPKIGMLLSRQIHKVDDRSQAQERLLVKVVQQNDETVQILRRVEIVVTGISEGMKIGFQEIGSQLSDLKNPEGLEEVKELWLKKMSDLEKVIANGGENSSNLIEKQMKKLDAMFTAKLFDLDVSSEGIKGELQKIQQQLIEANDSRLRGETAAEEKLERILDEMKGLQSQLDRVEAMTVKIFTSMESGFSDIRKELLENSNSEGLVELRDLWLRKVSDLEKSLSNGHSMEGLESQLKKMEVMMNAKLLDLDVNLASLSPQLSEVKQQLQGVLHGVHEGEENAQKRLAEMLSQLRGLQTDLVEVIRLQHENATHLQQVNLVYLSTHSHTWLCRGWVC